MSRYLKYLLGALPAIAWHVSSAQRNRRLQIHFINAGQGDGAGLIHNGPPTACAKPLAYLKSTHVDWGRGAWTQAS